MHAHPLTIRPATRSDARNLRILTALHGGPRPKGRILIAEVDYVPVAAISMTTGFLISDPARNTEEAIRKLRLCRYQLTKQAGRRPFSPVLTWAAPA
jgi:hypothetical protein